MMGVEPIQQALRSGAQIVVAGRSSDTSIFAALPLLDAPQSLGGPRRS
jgi:hypothetical protein